MNGPDFDKHLPQPDLDECPGDCDSHDGGPCSCAAAEEAHEIDVAEAIFEAQRCY